MEGHRKLGFARRPRYERILNAFRWWALSAALVCGFQHLYAQSTPPQLPAEQQLQSLANNQRWGDILSLLEPIPARSAAMDYYLGIALAQVGRLAEAQQALEAGRRLAPADPRFPVELAGIAFKQKNNPLAIRRLHEALRLTPNDTYTNDFLGTTYFLEGNLEAALKYWNRIGKPQIASVRAAPEPRISPALLDHAFVFSPAATLTLPQFLDSNSRLRGLGVFPQFQFGLNARPDGNFDVVFRGRERNGLGDSKLETLVLFFQGIPFQEVNPSYYNFHHEAINFTSMFRWDAQKRRIAVDLSGPFKRSAKERWQFTADLRDENWAIRNGFAGTAPVLASLNMRDEKLAFDLASYASARFGWSTGAELSHRDFRNVTQETAAGAILSPQMLSSGYALKQQAQLAGTLWRKPERRFTVSANATSDASRLWSQPSESFEKLTGSLGWHWFPQIKGDDYETSQQFRGGKIFGQAPFDELFILGLERDNNLPLRAHIGTRDGRKGSAPLGRDYLLENWGLDKNVYGNGIIKLRIGPFIDMGKITDPGTALGLHRWLFDAGGQVKLRVFGTGLTFSYGKDLRTGNNAFYVALL